MLKEVSVDITNSREVIRYRNYVVFMCIYVFLSGFVFVEPSPAEIWFTVALPFLILGLKTNRSIIFAFSALFLPMLLSAFIGLISFGVLNFRFVIIDTYLFVFFFVLASYAKSLTKNPYQERFLDRLMIPWSLAGAVNIIVGGFGYLTGRTMFYGAWILKYGRLTGFFKDPNVLGPFLVPVSAYFLMRFLKGRGNEFLNLAFFLFFSFGVLLTFSRAAWLNYAVTIVLLVGTAFLNRGTCLKALGFFVIAALIFFVFWYYFADKVNLLGVSLKDFTLGRLRFQSYDVARFEAQRMFIDILSSANAFFGIGPGNYELYSRMATHSLYARYIGERGLFGFCLFVMFWVIVLKKLFKSRSRGFLIPVLFGQLINSLFIDSLHWRHLWLLIELAFLG
ncbi:O-antigen ligase family protein [Pseudothermotoga hypogea]|nr:O-antigen ligase family protein [Pseudothermotoga hypogea]